MGIVQRLLDTAQMRTQYPEWLCKEMEAAAEEITRLRDDFDAMADRAWDYMYHAGESATRRGLKDAMNGANDELTRAGTASG